MNILGKIKSHFEYLWAIRSSQNFIRFLRRKGIVIGDGTYIQDPKHTLIDFSRPSLVTIGKNCFFNSHVSILTHDWVTNVFINSGRNFLNSSGRVTIGNNVSFGQNVMVLKGVSIGDNCFIGAGSIVTKDICSNSIAVGAPCRVIMSLEDYYQKRLKECEWEAFEYARSIKERFHRLPIPADFIEEFPFFVSGNEVDKYNDIPIRSQCGPAFDRFVRNHHSKYNSFNDFLRAAGL